MSKTHLVTYHIFNCTVEIIVRHIFIELLQIMSSEEMSGDIQSLRSSEGSNTDKTSRTFLWYAFCVGE